MVFITSCRLGFIGSVSFPDSERLPKFWYDTASSHIQRSLLYENSVKTARNIILFIGDGKRSGQCTFLCGSLQPGDGHQALCDPQTYCTDSQVADSSCAATAFLCGVKSNKFTVGLSANATYNLCNSTVGNEVHSLLSWAKDAGKSVGFVTTTRVQHATPAPLYAHCPNRYWYSDASIPADQRKPGCLDIAYQLVHNIRDIEVIMGGGRQHMSPQGTPDIEYPNENRYQDQLDKVDPERTDYLMGLFEPGDLAYELERNSSTDPSIVEMVDKAVHILRKNTQGFFLFVEGGKIDQGHHSGRAKLALYEAMLLDNAIERALELTDASETLTVVSADHSHTLSLGGYTDRGNPIFGFAPQVSDVDGMPYTSLLYANGPGFRVVNGQRSNPQNHSHKDYTPQAAVPLVEETHAGEDVPVYAQGPWSHLFKGTNEDVFIAHAMAYAACIAYKDNTENRDPKALKRKKRRIRDYETVEIRKAQTNDGAIHMPTKVQNMKAVNSKVL
uniref:Alkaline phosphatase n=1 Tax=Erpetoichthys calabaricus TaxID=27687 RepID=A0A8C4RU43_ERPCA